MSFKSKFEEFNNININLSNENKSLNFQIEELENAKNTVKYEEELCFLNKKIESITNNNKIQIDTLDKKILNYKNTIKYLFNEINKNKKLENDLKTLQEK
jgi:predicted RNase H-like nuclease (RuvC/YqgF family)